MLNQLLTELTCTYTPIRLVFFATISSNKHYNECLALIQEKVRNMFGSQAPVIQPCSTKHIEQGWFGSRGT